MPRRKIEPAQGVALRFPPISTKTSTETVDNSDVGDAALQTLTNVTDLRSTGERDAAFFQAIPLETHMNTNLPTDLPQRSRIHPLIAAAAVAVVLVSGTGIAAMTGLLPTSRAVTAPPPEQVASSALTGASMPVAAVNPAIAQGSTQRAEPSVPRVPHHHIARPAPSSVNENAYGNGSPTRQAAIDPSAGEIVAINTVQTPEQTTGVGAVGGAIAGGLLGNQVGGGRGRVLTTIAGAVGGGLAGNGIEHAVRKNTTYQVQVRMQDGSYRNFSYPAQPGFQIGEHVRVVGDSLSAA
jgi:outer membrane lipoprotein SlyB